MNVVQQYYWVFEHPTGYGILLFAYHNTTAVWVFICSPRRLGCPVCERIGVFTVSMIIHEYVPVWGCTSLRVWERVPFREMSSSTSCMKLATSGGSLWISLSLRPSLRRFSSLKNGWGGGKEGRITRYFDRLHIQIHNMSQSHNIVCFVFISRGMTLRKSRWLRLHGACAWPSFPSSHSLYCSKTRI